MKPFTQADKEAFLSGLHLCRSGSAFCHRRLSPQDLFAAMERVVPVSVETTRIVEGLPLAHAAGAVTE